MEVSLIFIIIILSLGAISFCFFSIIFYLFLRKNNIDRHFEKYENGIILIKELPYKFILKKMENSIIDNHYKDLYVKYKKEYEVLINKTLSDYLISLDKTKKDISFFSFSDIRPIIKKEDNKYSRVVLASLNILMKIDLNAYYKNFNKIVFTSVSEDFQYFKNEFQDRKFLLKVFSNSLDTWIQKIVNLFKKYNDFEIKRNDEQMRKTLKNIIGQIDLLVEKLEIFIIWAVTVENLITPRLKKITSASKTHSKIISKNTKDLKEASEDYKSKMKEVIKINIMEQSVLINNKMNDVIKSFRVFEIKFKRHIKAYLLSKDIFTFLEQYIRDKDTREKDLMSLDIKVEPLQQKKLITKIEKIKLISSDIKPIFDDYKIKYANAIKTFEFHQFVPLLQVTLEFIDKAKTYDKNFKDIAKFIIDNLKLNSKFENLLTEFNSYLIKIETLMKLNLIKLESFNNEIFEREKNYFNDFISKKNNNEIGLTKEYESELDSKIENLETIYLHLEKLSKANIVLDGGLLLLNKYYDSDDAKRNNLLDKANAEYKEGNYIKSLNSVANIISTYNIREKESK